MAIAFSFSLFVFVFVSGCVSGTPDQHLTAGVAAFQRGDTTAAVKEFKDAIRLDKKFAPAYYNLGICYSTAKQRDKAIAQFSKAIEKDPSYAEAYIALGQAYIRKDTLAAALAVLRRGLELGIMPAAFYENLGFCFMRMAQKDSAIACYRQAIALNPANADNYFNIGYMLSKPEQADSSIKYLRLGYQFAANKSAIAYLLGFRLLERTHRTAAETKEGIALLEDYLANGDHEPVKVSKANEMLYQVR